MFTLSTLGVSPSLNRFQCLDFTGFRLRTWVQKRYDQIYKGNIVGLEVLSCRFFTTTHVNSMYIVFMSVEGYFVDKTFLS